MEAKTAQELWKDGVEGRLNFQLYRCDVDSLLQEPEGEAESSLPLNLASYELESFDDILRDSRMISPGPRFIVLDSFIDEEGSEDVKLEGRVTPPPLHILFLGSSSDEEGSEDVKLEGRVTPPLRISDDLDSPTYEELFKQNWELFEDSDQELECHSTLNDVPEELELLDSPKVVCSVLPEPTCLTRLIQTMVMYPPIKVPKKRKRKNWGRRKGTWVPRKTAIMVSVDENDEEVKSEVEDPPEEIFGCTSFQQSIAESESSVCHNILEQILPRELLPLPGPPAIPRVLPTPPISAPEYFAEHLARCAVDWDYPKALFSIGGYDPEPLSQKRVPSQTRATCVRAGNVNLPHVQLSITDSSPTVPAQPMMPLAFEQKSPPALGASNLFSGKKRHASSNLSSDSEGLQTPRPSAGFNVGLENIEPTTKPTPRQNKRMRVVT